MRNHNIKQRLGQGNYLFYELFRLGAQSARQVEEKREGRTSQAISLDARWLIGYRVDNEPSDSQGKTIGYNIIGQEVPFFRAVAVIRPVQGMALEVVQFSAVQGRSLNLAGQEN